MTQAPTIAIVGQGYVGLPISMRAVEQGFNVIGYEIDAKRRDALADAQSYVEDVTNLDLKAALATGRFNPTSEIEALANFDYVLITVPTPLREAVPDLSYVTESAVALAPHIRPGVTIVLESTTYPGTTEDLLVPLLEKGSGLVAGRDFFVGYSPERIDPGNPSFGFVNTPKVVSGINTDSLAKVSELYSRLVEHVVPVSGTKEAELTKLLENTFRHVNIALVNELAIYSHDLNIDVWEAIDAASTKPFGFMKFTPGPGVGGHCLPVDPSYLSWQVRRTLGHSFRFVELANDVNEHMPDYVVQRLTSGLNDRELSIRGRKILLLGMAYKKNTSDARESPAVRVAELLVARGAKVTVVDPYLVASPVSGANHHLDLSEDLLVDSEAVVLLTDHDDFDYALLADADAYVLDTRNRGIAGADNL